MILSCLGWHVVRKWCPIWLPTDTRLRVSCISDVFCPRAACVQRVLGQVAMEQIWRMLDWSSCPPKQPTLSYIDGSRVVVKLAGTIPARALWEVDRIEVQAEPGLMLTCAASAEDVTVTRTRNSEKLRLRWLHGETRGPWSDWTHVVSAKLGQTWW